MINETLLTLQHRSTRITLLASLVLFAGCGKLSDTYGHSSGPTGKTSLNGFGVFRRAYENAGFETRDVRRLSDRVRKTDVIVWTPQVLGPIEPKVTKWFDTWLRRDGHTRPAVAGHFRAKP